jgi:hypothetical protein
MSVELDIYNSAIIKLGGTPLASADEDSKEGRLCRMQYPKIRNAALRSAPWGFAVKRKVLTPIDPNPLEFSDGDESVFQLPADCVRVWKLLDQPNIKYKVEGRYLIADDSSVNIYYISNAVAVDGFAADFMECAANLLAADLCYSLTQSTSLKASLESSAQFWINQARSNSSQEGTPDNYQFDTFLDSRTGGRAVYDQSN